MNLDLGVETKKAGPRGEAAFSCLGFSGETTDVFFSSNDASQCLQTDRERPISVWVSRGGRSQLPCPRAVGRDHSVVGHRKGREHGERGHFHWQTRLLRV